MYKQITEGKTKLLIPEEGKFGETEAGRIRKAPVFYNPRMKLNRDVCCSVVKVLRKEGEIKFADLLAGSGAKGIRVANETGCEVHLNDANKAAYELIKKNAELNDLNVAISNKDANLFLQEHYNSFNFIDLDPFGTPVPFLDNAVMMLKEGGFLGVTATDTAPLCGVYPKACFRKYSAKPIRAEFCHEVGLRILLGYVARTCAKYSKDIECLFSHSTEHYFRVYVKLSEGKIKANDSLDELGYVYYCKKCLNHEFKKEVLPSLTTCKCRNAFEIAGPLWLGKIKDTKFCKAVLEESMCLEDKKLEKLIEMIANEIEIPFYYDTHKIFKKLKIDAIPMEEIIRRLTNAGHKASRTHFSLTSLKTSANIEEIKTKIKE